MSSTGAAPAIANTGGNTLFLTGAVLSGLSALTLIITLITTAAKVGSSDSWSSIKGSLTGVIVSSMLGGILFTVGLVLLLWARPQLTGIVPAAISALALSISVTAVSVAAISR